MLPISTTKILVAETSYGDYNFHRWTCKPSDDYLLNSKHTCKPSELHTIMKKCNGTGLVLKMCETKNNGWKRCILSIQWSIDNNIETTRIKPNFASLNSGHLSRKSLFYWDCGSFIFPCDVNVMLRMMCHYFSYSKWALFSWCAVSCKSVIENSCKLKVQSNMVADRKRAASV